MPYPTLAKLMARIAVTDDGCWMWTGAIATSNGYGLLSWRQDGERRTATAHRLVYAALGHIVPDGLEVDHLCNVRACVNPEHLEPVTHAENVRRSVVRRREAKGAA